MNWYSFCLGALCGFGLTVLIVYVVAVIDVMRDGLNA